MKSATLYADVMVPHSVALQLKTSNSLAVILAGSLWWTALGDTRFAFLNNISAATVRLIGMISLPCLTSFRAIWPSINPERIEILI